MNILHAVETMSRSGGGLPVAVGELACAQSKVKGHRPSILTTPCPVGEFDPASLTSAGVEIHFSPASHDGNFDIVHQHGLWARLPVSAGSFAKQNGIPLLLSPHGMLEPWALRHHGWRKKIARLLYQNRNLRAAAALVASSKYEAQQLRKLGLRQPIAILPHGVAIAPEGAKKVRSPDAPRTVLMLSRIHPKKGIDLLLDAWQQVAPEGWQLVIAGNDDGGHRAALEARMIALGIASSVRFAGPVFGGEKNELLRCSDLFVLPSHSENFGIVVAEALQARLPVITTTGTPWHHLEREGCGWCVAPTVDAISRALQTAIALTDSQRAEMGTHAAALIQRDHRWPDIATQYLQLYRWMMAGSRDCDLPDFLLND